MIDEQDIPDSVLERVKRLEQILIAAATGGSDEDQLYEDLRREVMRDSTIKALMPEFVRSCRNLSMFWPFIKHEAATYAERRQIIGEAFNPLINHLEEVDRTPGDFVVSDTLQTFDEQSVNAVWSKALSRRVTDPEGAITIARTLLETVIKRILDELSVDYADKDDLPKLYSKVAKALNLAPSQHSEEPIKAILGAAMNLVNGIGTLRNRLSDAHGRGGRLPVRPSARHANLTVNTAGAVALFLVQTHFERQEK